MTNSVSLRENITAVVTKKAKATLLEGDPLTYPLVFIEECVIEINVKDIGGYPEETVVVKRRKSARTYRERAHQVSVPND